MNKSPVICRVLNAITKPEVIYVAAKDPEVRPLYLTVCQHSKMALVAVGVDCGNTSGLLLLLMMVS